MPLLRLSTPGAIVLLATLGAAQDLIDLPWRSSDDGRLQYQSIDPDPTVAPGAWLPMFPGLLEAPTGALTADPGLLQQPFVLVPLLLTGDGGAAALDDATRRLHKLGIAVSFDAVAVSRRDADPLRDLLRVRHLGGLDLAAGHYALAQWARDPARDPFVRAAAWNELAVHEQARDWREWDEVQRGRAERNGPAALHAALERLPDDFDLVLGVHSAALPTPRRLLEAWRQSLLRLASSGVLEAGASLSPAQIRAGQLAIDRPGQLPYELAVRFGNWRVDYALLARRQADAGWWFHLGGRFLPDRLREGLRQSGFRVATGDDLEATVGGWHVRATATTLEGWREATPPTARGTQTPSFERRAAPGAPPVWLHLRATGDLAAALPGWRTLDVDFEPGAHRLTATAACRDAPAATACRERFAAWQAGHRCDPDARAGEDGTGTWRDIETAVPGLGEQQRWRWTFRRLAQAVVCRVDGDRLQGTCDLSVFPLDDLVRLLSLPPRTVFERG